jgi:hypothetical protein
MWLFIEYSLSVLNIVRYTGHYDDVTLAGDISVTGNYGFLCWEA